MDNSLALLLELRGYFNLARIRPVNEYVDGVLRHSGRYEYYCEHCSAKAARMPDDIEHQPQCLVARIDAALKASA